MFFISLILATSLSIDALGIGIAYGLKKTKISPLGNIVLFIISALVVGFSTFLGSVISSTFSPMLCNFIGIILLVLMGIWIIFQSTKDTKEEEKNMITKKCKPKIFKLILKPLGITIKIIHNPSLSDLDNSNTIDAKESIYLGFALSIDALCAGISSSMIGISPYIFPFLVAALQLMFLSLGHFFSARIISKTKIPDNIYTILSGTLLILIGLIRLINL